VNRRHVFSILACFTVVVIAFITLTDPADDISSDELRRRVEATSTDWANYHEDLKGQIGSTPVARWKGEPVSSRVEGSTIYIVFEVSGFWAETDVNLPLIIRDPFGKTFADDGGTRIGSNVTYTFSVSGDDLARIPWIELRYPHSTRRIVYAEGKWEGE